jgi:PhzF family phenazine biosynthesis protein
VAEFEVARLDVFTNDLYAGNPAWVVFGADTLDDVQLGRVAFELGGPSTAFVLRSKKADVRLRYFTPSSEEPISGHATIGALWALAERGAFGGAPGGRHRLETPVGILPFSFDFNSEGVERAWMTQKKPLFAKVDEFKEIASALGIGADSLFHDAFPISRASTGLPCLLVPVRSLEAIKRIEPRAGEMAELAKELEVFAIMVYTWSVLEPGSSLHTRCYLPGPPAQEDIASGMPAGALCAYLVEHEFIPRDRSGDITVEQGHWLGRPSKIHVRIERKGATIRKVEVGGSARTSATGKISVE